MTKLFSFSSMIAVTGALFLLACSSPETGNSKTKGAASRENRTLRVSGYIAKPDSTTGTYSANGELIAKKRVELKTETSGRLVKLPVSDGAKVSAGTLIAKLDDSELRANLKSAEASLELAKRKEARTKTLFEKDGATAEELESAENARKVSEASVELIRAQIAKTEIRAPFAGTLGVVDVSEGAWMTADSEISSLVDARELWTEFEIPQRYSRSVKVGDRISLTDAERNLEGTATVRFMDSELSNTSRTRKIRAVLKNPDGKFLAGSFVRVEIRFGKGSEVGMPIPSEALTLDADGAYVFVVNGGKAKRVYVRTGLRTPITVNVLDGLSAGDTVIVSGLMNMRDGMNVDIKEINNNMSYEARE